MSVRRLVGFGALIGAGLIVGCHGPEGSSPAGGVGAMGPIGPKPAPTASPVGACPVCSAPEVRGAILNRDVKEASGLAASAAHPGVLYTHNDSGDGPRFFAMTQSGADLGAFDVSGAEAIDWEDIALGPCAPGAAGKCIYLADTGDNKRHRSTYVIYRVAEPASLEGASRTVTPEVLTFVYPDGPHDAESLLVHPTTGVVTIVTKVKEGSSPIYELPMPLTPGRPMTAVRVGEVSPPRGSPRFTAGAVHPQAKGVLLRTYTNVFYYAMGPGQTAAQAVMGAPCELPAASEEQGEAIEWLPAGNGYVTTSEGKGSALNVVTCGG